MLKPETRLFGPEGLGLDSIDALEIVVELKKRFKVQIADPAAGEKAFNVHAVMDNGVYAGGVTVYVTKA